MKGWVYLEPLHVSDVDAAHALGFFVGLCGLSTASLSKAQKRYLI
jgi:hypothetical protein